MTWQLFLYQGAELVLPPAPVEIRPALSVPAPCPAHTDLLRSSELKVWGTIRGENARLIVGPGELVFDDPRHPVFRENLETTHDVKDCILSSSNPQHAHFSSTRYL